jgi:hypothetical protein
MAKKTTKKSSVRSHAGGQRSKKTVRKAASKKVAKKTTKKKTTKKPAAKKPAAKKVTKKAGKKPAVKRTANRGSKKGTSKKIKPGKMVYSFGAIQTEGDVSMKELLGGKGANLADMTSIGLPVPPGFTITTETCQKYNQGGKRLPHNMMNEVHRHMALVQKETGKVFGDGQPAARVGAFGRGRLDAGHDGHRPEPGSQRRGGRGPRAADGQPRFAYDAYRRLINMFGDVVMGVDHHKFEHAFDKIKKQVRREGRYRRSRGGHGRAGRGLQGGLPLERGGSVPAEPVQAARALDRGGVQELGLEEGAEVPSAQPHHGSDRDRGERAGDGLREHGRRLGHGRRVHAQPVDRREQVLRRVPDQRAGRGRRRGHPHAQARERDVGVGQEVATPSS